VNVAELARKPSRSLTVVRNGDLRVFEMMGNYMAGLATPSHGARELEVWHSIVDAGRATPVHSHNCEEIVIVVKGRGEARLIGSETIPFEAPCTLILPAHELHQLANTSTEPYETIAVLRIGSKVFDEKGVEMALPWRE
jgi:mannose-6-phosphate isomerase-like protein (cupin superfamily)